eukprot:s5622_g2.t1
MPEPMSEPPPVPDISPLASPPATPSSTTRVRPPRPPTTTVVDAPSSRGDVTYQGPVETTTLISYTVHPSPKEEEAALPRRDRIVQICQSDHMLDWIHALATITIMKEPAITGGNTATEQILMCKHRVNSLRKVPWIFAPIKLASTDRGATWADVTAAKLVVGAAGQLTLLIGEGDRYVELKTPTVFYGIIHSLFSRMWDRREMNDILETDENFEIVASTMKCIYGQTCRKCGSDNRVIFYQPKAGRTQRKLRIEHGKGDTQAYIWNRQKEEKRMGDAQSFQTDKRLREGGSGSGYDDSQRSDRRWWSRDYQGDSGSHSSGSRQWRGGPRATVFYNESSCQGVQDL